MCNFGLYIHIPYCRKACTYCDFYFSTSRRSWNLWFEALLTEIKLRGQSWTAGKRLSSIYFGGGTPSLLESHELEQILSAIYEQWSLESDAEITLEANPEDLSETKLSDFRSAGINRLSIGVQAFDAEELKHMNRAHTLADAERVLETVPAAGFTNYSIDLIYATPWLSDERWQENVLKLIDHMVPHISAYALTVEEKTKLYYQIKKGILVPASEEIFESQFLILHNLLSLNGYEAYEISNFARPGFRARHNSSYWKNLPYLGLGPSAHSFDGLSRFWNVRNVWDYLENLQQGQLPVETTEALTADDPFNEYIMTRLRTIEGILWQEISERFGINLQETHADTLVDFVSRGWLITDKSGARLTLMGRMRADGIAAQLFL